MNNLPIKVSVGEGVCLVEIDVYQIILTADNANVLADKLKEAVARLRGGAIEPNVLEKGDAVYYCNNCNGTGLVSHLLIPCVACKGLGVVKLSKEPYERTAERFLDKPNQPYI